jgi:hypothetical protein
MVYNTQIQKTTLVYDFTLLPVFKKGKTLGPVEYKQKESTAKCPWLMPVILLTLEAEINRIAV